MKSRQLFCFPFMPMLAAVALFLATGCVPAPEEPACLPADLVAPVSLLPNDASGIPGSTPIVDTLTPTFTWDYPGGCKPEGYTISLYQPYPGGGSSNAFSAIEGKSWTPATPLLAASTYTWEVAAQSGETVGPASERAMFLTGPLCASPYPSPYPAPVLLAPEDGIVITTGSDITTSDGEIIPTVTFYMIWDDPAACLPEYGYNIQVSDSPSFPDDAAHTTILAQDYHTIALFFFPPGSTWSECQPYYWRIQANLPSGADGPFSEVRSFIINTHGLDCSLGPVPIFTATPTATATATVTLGTPFVWVLQDAVCRAGPTLDHPILDYLTKGMLLPIEGRNQDGSWWWVFNERIHNRCWVANGVVELRGGTGNLPVVTPIPPPLPEPTGTTAPVVGCWVFNQQQQLVCVAPCPPNAVPGGACTP